MFWKKGQKENLEIEYAIVLKDNAFEIIKKVKGWKTDAELARHLDFTRQYICSLKKRKLPCTHDVMVRIAIILGDTTGNWWNHFEMVKVGKYDANHQKWNHNKYDGKQPYTKRSLMASFRRKDGEVEEKQDN